MKYISIIKVMDMYARYVKASRSMCTLNEYRLTDRRLVPNRDYSLFSISTKADGTEGKQIINEISIKPGLNKTALFGYAMKDVLELFPIFELSWLRKRLTLSSKVFAALNQLAYMYVLWVTFEAYDSELDLDGDVKCVQKVLDEEDAVIECDDIKDAPEILKRFGKCSCKNEKLAPYQIFLFPAEGFVKLFRLCSNQSRQFMECMYHLPLMLALFNMELEMGTLQEWDETDRLSLVEEIQRIKRDMLSTSSESINIDTYTYATTNRKTMADIRLIFLLFDQVIDELTKANRDMGTITYSSYRSIAKTASDEKVTASIRLCNMDIDWDDEIERKKNEEQQSKGSD